MYIYLRVDTTYSWFGAEANLEPKSLSAAYVCEALVPHATSV